MRRTVLLALTALTLGLTACDPPSPRPDAKPLIPAESAPSSGHTKHAQVAVPEGMVHVPAGPFIMGTDETDAEGRGEELGLMVPWFATAQPAHTVDLPGFFVDITEVTNGDYAEFVATGHIHPPPHWRGRPTPPQGLENHPVTHVNLHEAQAYCEFRGKTLPTEPQWEKAARGTDGRNYPWGNDYRHDQVTVARNNTTPVGSHTGSDSPYGAKDMIGNVWEWTTSWYQPYPGSHYQSDKFGTRAKVLRGNSWASVGHYPDEQDFMDIVANNSRVTYRLFLTPSGRLNDVGFRCIRPE